MPRQPRIRLGGVTISQASPRRAGPMACVCAHQPRRLHQRAPLTPCSHALRGPGVLPGRHRRLPRVRATLVRDAGDGRLYGSLVLRANARGRLSDRGRCPADTRATSPSCPPPSPSSSATPRAASRVPMATRRGASGWWCCGAGLLLSVGRARPVRPAGLVRVLPDRRASALQQTPRKMGLAGGVTPGWRLLQFAARLCYVCTICSRCERARPVPHRCAGAASRCMPAR
jgi:hypothetical protein